MNLLNTHETHESINIDSDMFDENPADFFYPPLMSIRSNSDSDDDLKYNSVTDDLPMKDEYSEKLRR